MKRTRSIALVVLAFGLAVVGCDSGAAGPDMVLDLSDMVDDSGSLPTLEPAFTIEETRALREGYLEALHAFLESTRKACGRLSIDYMQVRTSEPLDAVLAKFLATRTSLPNLKV